MKTLRLKKELKGRLQELQDLSKQLGFKSFNDFLNEALLHFLKFKHDENPISSSLQEIKDEIRFLKVNGRTYASPEPHLPLTPVNVIAAQYSHLGPEAFRRAR